MRRFIFLFLFISCFSIAKLEISEETQFYLINPDSEKELISALNKASPIREDGEIFHGHTKYDINWRFWWKSKNNSCRITKAKTTLVLKFTMPQLESSIVDVQSVWSNWYPNLIKHEYGHAELARKIARKIDKSLLLMGSRPNCELLENDANKLAYKLMAELKLANKKYDKDTNHGETQRAWIYTHL